MLISVITVCYNAQATIARTVESFLAQDYPQREMVVIDGASSDRTLAIVESYASPLIRIHSERDKGIYDAINKGIGRAQGEVIGLLHANDHFADDGVLGRIAAAFADPALDAVFADVTFFAPGQPQRVVRRYRSDRFNASLLSYGWMPAHPTLYLRRGVFDRFGLYRTDLRIAGDFEFVARIFKDGALRYRYFDEVWTRMQTNGASTGGLRSKWILNTEVLRACRDLGLPSSGLRLLAKYPRKILELLQK
jgi:glycosyltransferase involved in cell wall biosynthesis